MKRLLLLFLGVSAFAQTTLHIYSPWAGDALMLANRHILYGGATAYSANASSEMTAEGGGFFSYTWPATRTFTYEDVTLANCPGTDVNCPGKVEWKNPSATVIKPVIATLFGSESEVWLYPDASAQGYSLSTIPPGAKIVWFKSPWASNVLPNMIVGTDTLRMRYSTDPARCGWFFSWLRDAQKTAGVYFQRPHTSLTIPATGVIDMTTAVADTAFVDNGGSLSIDAATVTAGTCFDSTKVVHVLNPWATDPARQNLPVYVKAGNLTGNYKVMAPDSYTDWYSYGFDATTTWSQNEVVEFKSYYPTPENAELKFPQTYPGKMLFPPGEYEVWLVPSITTFKVLRAPVSPRTIHFMNPWENTIPKLIAGTDTVRMRSIPDTCGWYRATLWDEPSTWDVKFGQALGYEIYSSTGFEDTTLIALDSVMKLTDTAWVMPNPFPNGSAAVSSAYPTGVLGVCPNRKIAVMLFDWAGESFPDSEDPDFGGTYNSCQGLVPGMVEPLLGDNGMPLRSATFPEAKCSKATDLNNWFQAQTITGTYTNAACRDLDLSLDADGFWLADISESSPAGGFFPLDDFKFLDAANTIANPKYDHIEQSSGVFHNYSFSMRVQAEFKYIKGQFFEFRGDDDVWVFINKKLAVDIGGVHGPIQGSVNLDTLGLTEGETYPFNIFFAERNATGSNFKMRTSIDLRTERSYYPVKLESDPTLTRYEIRQIVKTEGLQCDFSASAKSDTVKAPSNFFLSGPMFPDGPKTLTAGANYAGIIIDADYTGFTIDTLAIVRARSLAPGKYKLRFVHSLDPSLSFTVEFTVPTYPMPTIVFTDSLWNVINPDTVQLGEWASVPYPVHIEARYTGIKCPDCTDEIRFTTKDSLDFLDAAKQPITGMKLDSGRATFWVMGLTAVDSAQFRVFGPKVVDTLVWRYINLKEPPVPVQRLAAMYDRNGDGVGDSLIIGYSRPLLGKDAPDSLRWSFGDSTFHPMDSLGIASQIVVDSTIVLTGDSLVGFPFTGNVDGKPYAGAIVSSFTYVPTDGVDAGKRLPFQITGAIADKIGPVILTAEVGPGKTLDTLFVTFSESMPADSIKLADLFELHIIRAGVERSTDAHLYGGSKRSENTRYTLLYDNSIEVIPNVGDSIRLVPGRGYDVSGNVAHEANPFVRIVGRQRANIETVGLVTYSASNAPGKDAPAVRVVRAKLGQTVEDMVAQEGVPGHLIRFDLSNVIQNSSVNLDPSKVRLAYETWYFTNLGAYVNNAKGSVACTDSIFNGDCTKFPGNIFIGWNLRAKSGRLVSTGPYISELGFKVYNGSSLLTSEKSSQIWGIRRKK